MYVIYIYFTSTFVCKNDHNARKNGGQLMQKGKHKHLTMLSNIKSKDYENIKREAEDRSSRQKRLL